MKGRWIPLAAFVCVLGAFLFIVWPKGHNLPGEPPIGQVQTVVGEALARHPGQDHFQKLSVGESLWSGSLIQTTALAEVVLVFDQKFRLNSQSRVRLEQVGPKRRIYILSGDIQALSTASPSVEIVRAPINQEAPESLPSQLDPAPEPDGPPQQGEPDWLKETLSLHRRFLEKCFIQYMERLAELPPDGFVSLRITISTSGKVTQVQELKNSYQDPQLGQCVREVVKRMRIKRSFPEEQTLELPVRFSGPHLQEKAI